MDFECLQRVPCICFQNCEMRVRRKNNYAVIVSELRRPYDERDHSERRTRRV